MIHDPWYDFIFLFLWVLKGEGVVIVHYDLDAVLTPDVEHRGVDYVSKAALRIVSNCFADSGGVISSAMEPPSTTCESCKIADSK